LLKKLPFRIAVHLAEWLESAVLYRKDRKNKGWSSDFCMEMSVRVFCGCKKESRQDKEIS